MVSLLDGLEAKSPAFRAFEEQVARAEAERLAQQNLPVPPVVPAQAAYQQQPGQAPQAYPQTIPPWLLPGYEPPGMGAPDREREFRADHIAREKYRAALLADTPFYPTGSASYQPGLEKETLWRGLKGAEFAQKALPVAFTGGFLVDKFLPEGKTRSLLSGFSPFKHARLDEVAHRNALIRNQGVIMNDPSPGYYRENPLHEVSGPGAVYDFEQQQAAINAPRALQVVPADSFNEEQAINEAIENAETYGGHPDDYY